MLRVMVGVLPEPVLHVGRAKKRRAIYLRRRGFVGIVLRGRVVFLARCSFRAWLPVVRLLVEPRPRRWWRRGARRACGPGRRRGARRACGPGRRRGARPGRGVPVVRPLVEPRPRRWWRRGARRRRGARAGRAIWFSRGGGSWWRKPSTCPDVGGVRTEHQAEFDAGSACGGRGVSHTPATESH